ncbi:MAG: hypothetical protein AB1696_01955 [Planctomycetota bacterium]
MQVNIFGKPRCGKCVTTKKKLSHFLDRWGVVDKVSVIFYDMSTPDGLAEGAYNDVLNIPTVIIRDGEKNLARWDGVVPKTEDVRLHLQDRPNATAH